MLFSIAEHRVRITCTDNGDIMSLLPSYRSFMIQEDGGDVLLDIVVDNSMKPVAKEERRLIRHVDTGNGRTSVYRCEHHLHDKQGNEKVESYGYLYYIRDLNDRGCALLFADENFHHCRCALAGNKNMQFYGLNSSIMLCYAFCTASYDTVLIHASLVRRKGRGYAFTAKSGTGKSTQVSNWLRFIPGCDLMNDDNPIVRIIDGIAYIYGSPWSGKTPCYRNVKAQLGGVAQINRAQQNSIEPLSTVNAFVTFLPSCSTMRWDERVFRDNTITVSKVLESVRIYNLYCLPDRESAEVAAEGMGAWKRE